MRWTSVQQRFDLGLFAFIDSTESKYEKEIETMGNEGMTLSKGREPD